MEPMQTDNGSTLISLQTSSSPPPSLGGPPFESDPHHGIELLHSVPFSLTSEMSSAGDDVEEVCPQGDHAPDTFDLPAAHHNHRLDNETADVIIETEVLSSGLSSVSSKQFSGNPTSVTELVDSIPTFPSHPCAEGSDPGPRPVGQESADVNFLNEGDTAIAVQFASPAVVASQDDDIADTGERTSSPCEIVGYVSPSPPSYSSRVDFVYPVVVTDPIDVVVEERSSSWEWAPRFSEEHDYEVPSPFVMAEDNSAAIKERAPETSSPCHYTTVGVQFSPRSRVAANANDNDDVMQDEESAAFERREHVHSPPLSYAKVAPSADGGADHHHDAILEPESFGGERSEFVPFSPQPYTMTSGIASRVNVADDDIVVVQEPESSSKEIHRPVSPPSSTMAVDFASPTAVAFDSDAAPADVSQPPLENLVADDYASPLAVKNDDDVLVWEETVADKTASPASVPHDDIVIVQEAMTVNMSSSVVVRDDDGTVAEDIMTVEFASPAVGQNDDGVVVEDMIAFKSPSPSVTNDDVGVLEDAMAAEFASSEVVSNDDVVVLQDLCAVESTSRAIFLDEDPMVVQETNVDGLGAPDVVRDDVVVMQEAVAVIPPSPAADQDDCAVGVEDAAAVELVALDAVPGDTAVIVQDREAVEIASSAVAAHDDGVVLQDSSQFASLGRSPLSPPPGGTGVVVSSSAVAVEDNLVLQGQTSSSVAGPRHESSFTPALVDDSKSGQCKEGFQCCGTDDVSPGKQPAFISLPKVFEVPVGVEQASNAAEPSSEALEVASPRESPSYPGDCNFVFMNGPEGVSTFFAAEQAHEVDDDIFDEHQPAKKAKTGGTIYSGTDAVAVVLGQTAEIVLVLAGMAQMRAGKVPTSYERELATSANQKLGILVSQLPPNNLVAIESLERMLQDYKNKKVAQKKREDQAWMEALNEAEALANVRTETLARANAEAAARAQAEVAARAQAGVAARAQVEAEELERRQEAAMKAAAANGPSKGGYSSVGGSPLSSGQSAYRAPDLTQSPTFPTSAVHHNSQVEIGSQIPSPITKASEIPRSVNPAEKSISVNGQSHAPISKPSLGRPPKVRNRVRKEPATVTIFTPEFLNEVQSQAPDPQKAHLTHKQLCAGVQQFIREHVPPVSQNLQALSPTYISTPFPCQVCKLIAKDTGSVLVCDSCDEVSHVKCVQPPSSRGASKGDWNCPKCLTASRGAKCPSKYGPIRPGSPNSVKLWPPHDTSAGDPESIRSSTNGSVREERGSATAGIGPVLLKVQGKTGLEIDTLAHQVMDDPSTGNLGSSPHLIVHLVNEPSPRPSNPISGSSNSLLQDDNQALFPSGKSGSSLVQETTALELLTKEISTEDQTELIGQISTKTIQIDSLNTVHTDEKSERVLEKTYTQSAAVAEDTVPEAKSRRATPVQIKKTETRTQTIQSKKGNLESGVILPAKQSDVPLPIVMEWVGESTRKAEGKVYYRACSVGGITFSVSDCALFRPETPDVPPYIARLQVLWEDIATGHKWVRVSWCYYPTDIPMAMGRPGTTAPDEVYESNHCDNNLVGSIQGPCFVLPPLKFMEEMESRRTLKKRGEAVDELPPIFLSRWMYDAPKGVFRPLQE